MLLKMDKCQVIAKSKVVKNGIITNSAIGLANIFTICCLSDSENCTGILKKNNKKWLLHQQIIL